MAIESAGKDAEVMAFVFAYIGSFGRDRMMRADNGVTHQLPYPSLKPPLRAASREH